MSAPLVMSEYFASLVQNYLFRTRQVKPQRVHLHSEATIKSLELGILLWHLMYNGMFVLVEALPIIGGCGGPRDGDGVSGKALAGKSYAEPADEKTEHRSRLSMT